MQHVSTECRYKNEVNASGKISELLINKIMTFVTY